jgi:hypothetical protein
MSSELKVDGYVAKLKPPQREIVEALRKLVREAAPGATEVFKWAQPVYEQNGPFAFIKAHANHVTFGFWRGVELDGGRGLLESGGRQMAHLKLRHPADVKKGELSRLVTEAVRLNLEKGDPTRNR